MREELKTRRGEIQARLAAPRWRSADAYRRLAESLHQAMEGEEVRIRKLIAYPSPASRKPRGELQRGF